MSVDECGEGGGVRRMTSTQLMTQHARGGQQWRHHHGMLAAAIVVLAAAATLPRAIAENQCSITQNCHSYALDSPCHAIPSNKKPSPMVNFTQPPACPQFQENSCCNDFQNMYLSFNFMLIDAAFGSAAAGGCPACAANIKQLWCEFTCSPNQADFVEAIGIENVTDPETKVVVEVLHAAISIEAETACSMYSSCRDTVKARQVQTLKSCSGFLDYQGNYEAIGRGNLIDFIYAGHADELGADAARIDSASDDGPPGFQFNHSLSFPIHACNNYTIDGVQGSCACDTCRESCPHTGGSVNIDKIREQAKIDPLHGARWALIGGTYAVIFIVSVGILLYRAARDGS